MAVQGQSLLVGVIPDKIFGIEFLDRPEGQRKAYFFLEVNRGTMPATRTSLTQTSFARKLLGYVHTRRQDIHTAHFGIRRFRVLTLTTSAERVRSFIDVYKQHGEGLCPPTVFLFGDMKNFVENPFHVPLLDGNGERMSLVG